MNRKHRPAKLQGEKKGYVKITRPKHANSGGSGRETRYKFNDSLAGPRCHTPIRTTNCDRIKQPTRGWRVVAEHRPGVESRVSSKAVKMCAVLIFYTGEIRFFSLMWSAGTGINGESSENYER